MPDYKELTERAEKYFCVAESAPDATWFRELFMLRGDHMILTDEGWQPGDVKQSVIDEFGEDAIQDEVNALVERLNA